MLLLRRVHTSTLVFGALLIAAAGCHRSPTAKSPDAKNADSKNAAAGDSTTKSVVVPIGKAMSGSTVVLAKVEGRRVAFISDSDTHSILTVDLDSKTEGGALRLGARPGELLMLNTGKLIVLSPDESKIVTIGALEDGGTDRAFINVATEPRGLALSPDSSMVYVSSGWGRALSAFETKEFGKKFEVPLAREPRSVVVSDDGKRVFISHSVGAHLSVVDAATHAPKLVDLRGEDMVAVEQLRAFEQSRQAASAALTTMVANTTNARQKAVLIAEGKRDSKKSKEELQAEKRVKEGLPTCQSFALAKSTSLGGRLFIPEVVVDPGEVEVKSDGYGSGNGADSETPAVAVLDPTTGTPLPISMRRTAERMSGRGGGVSGAEPHCLLPRAAAVDEKGHQLLVACLGIDSLVAYDATSASPATAELHRWKVGGGPSGVAVDPETHQAIVWSQFDRTLSIIPLSDSTEKNGQPQAIARIAMGREDGDDTAPTSLALGRVLFHRSNDGRISGDGRSCASCHPDGRDDGLVWSTPEGPRRSIMLAGRLETAPFSWQGNTSTVQKHLNGTFQRLGGGGLEGAELDALVNYVKSLRPKADWRRHDGEEAAEKKIAAGARIFDSPKTGCSSCHSGTSFTDGAMHNVGSGRTFNTPSLLNVGSGGPWFHDGRYTSLTDLLKKSDGKMGHTKHLKPEDFENLEAFLKVL